ncbi:alanine racemase [Leucobacter denitrificans]|uniref:Alanine racemase n=2 Tax=Leucobacter denitrificans TaxID=683042 RepID=A0A7G9S873_9MICO|nr:alanine racemase [Leucobacter denitrificans]
MEALCANAHDLLRRAGGLPIRVASKSIRVRAVLDAVLALPGFSGVLAYSLAEAVWLSDTIDDIVVAYPSVDRAAIAALATDERVAERVTIMVDSVDQLDVIDSVLPPTKRASIRVCLDFDASWQSGVLGHIGVLRSPIHNPRDLRELAECVSQRPGFTVVGVMSYEAQIAGVGDKPVGKPATGLLMRAIQRMSGAELRERRAEAIASVREVAELEFVNGGGTGSIESTVAEGAVTEVAAGSGLYGPHLFDNYRQFTPAPAVAFALDVVRKPSANAATLLGGGWIASGPAGEDRLPQLTWPTGLSYAPREAAGEVQTPVTGDAARDLRVGDRVWLRHTKSGEPMEHADSVVPVIGGVADDPVPTYRGEGKHFL